MNKPNKDHALEEELESLAMQFHSHESTRAVCQQGKDVGNLVRLRGHSARKQHREPLIGQRGSFLNAHLECLSSDMEGSCEYTE
jgi:hypothetical protein